jgi:chromosome partitioning protein
MAVARTGPKTVGVSNQKGGVGKTATSVNIAAALSTLGFKVLLVDGDYQGNSTDYLGLKAQAVLNKITLFDGIRLEKPIEDCILPTKFPNLFLIGASQYMSQWEKQGYKYHKIKTWFSSKFIQDFDYVIFDTRPQFGSLFENIFAYVDWYLIPTFAEPDAVSGLKIELDELREVQEAYNSDLKSAGLLITKFKKRNSTHDEYQKIITNISESKGLTFLGEIPDSDAISGSVNKRTPLPFYPETMKLPVRDAYMNIAKKLVKNLVYKKGRVPTIPSIPEQFANDVLARFSQEPLELNLE